MTKWSYPTPCRVGVQHGVARLAAATMASGEWKGCGARVQSNTAVALLACTGGRCKVGHVDHSPSGVKGHSRCGDERPTDGMITSMRSSDATYTHVMIRD